MSSKPKKPVEFERFEALAKRLLGVDKKEIDEREKERPRRQRRTKKPDSK